jgi:hypothetical protein
MSASRTTTDWPGEKDQKKFGDCSRALLCASRPRLWNQCLAIQAVDLRDWLSERLGTRSAVSSAIQNLFLFITCYYMYYYFYDIWKDSDIMSTEPDKPQTEQNECAAIKKTRIQSVSKFYV